MVIIRFTYFKMTVGGGKVWYDLVTPSYACYLCTGSDNAWRKLDVE